MLAKFPKKITMDPKLLKEVNAMEGIGKGSMDTVSAGCDVECVLELTCIYFRVLVRQCTTVKVSTCHAATYCSPMPTLLCALDFRRAKHASCTRLALLCACTDQGVPDNGQGVSSGCAAKGQDGWALQALQGAGRGVSLHVKKTIVY